jgi:GDP-D-mannose dehydratase
MIGDERNIIPPRPAEVEVTLADISETTKDLGWVPKHNLKEVIDDY